ncbi:DEAD-box ATP-dependent RNA helicase 21 [Acorus calamus]|uniref:DEAD-box ATP-dependent RNA helicase 21 n=1 Tax=Acorus calamus TaxID=4465 RepID=A0AAV9DRQ0_ACOCL|nr:DEAD-box ATP-dependent RNA helicase 21 [Acorus calamus]
MAPTTITTTTTTNAAQKRLWFTAATENDSVVQGPPKKRMVKGMSLLEWGILCKDNGIKYSGLRADRPRPHPMRSWPESGLRPKLINAVDPFGDRDPLPIQMVAVPLGVQQRDLIALCAPVPGKITAYLLPMLQHICHCSRLDREACSHPLAVIVVPNRQLAEKVARVMERLSRYMVDVKVSLILDEGDALNKLGRGSHVIVGTVDQLGKCIERSTLVMRQSCGYLIMDEADYMVEMGFDKELEAMLKAMPRRRTIHVYTETMPTSLEKLTRRHLHDPINVAVDREVSKALEQRASEKKVQMLKKRAAAKLLFH